ncbi:hypothetical protein MOQ72_43750 [Saccharopolyspora sp. K220]|uniref:hypothetical protein n=1 Tax=Saccharopolyspora soli TaxID=2926618 RepID=UPI001F584E7F|nr:hypothetical protein [Saccharopolyspora soli]MCI2424327.1 hypothetical protein [Saccharopolyspora soli]
MAAARTPGERLIAVAQSLVALTRDNQPDADEVDAVVDEFAQDMTRKLREIYARRYRQATPRK